MPFTPDNAKVNHYPGTSKEAVEVGFERIDMPSSDDSNNMARLNGRVFHTDQDMTKVSD